MVTDILADGRAAVIERVSGPVANRFTTARNMPVEPDEVWQIADLYDRLREIQSDKRARSRDVQVAVDAERRRIIESLNLCLDRVGVTGRQLEELARDTPPVVEAYILNQMLAGVDDARARQADNPNPLIVTLKGRGMRQDASRELRVEVSLPSGITRRIPMTFISVDKSGKYLEWVAERPVSAYGAVVGSWCSVLLDVTLYSGARMTRCVTRFALD